MIINDIKKNQKPFVRCLTSDLTKACTLALIIHTLSCKMFKQVFSCNMDIRALRW